MASKKVFTDLAFQGGAQLVNPMLHVNTGDPTVAGAGHVYYDGSANVNHLKVAVDNSTFKNIPHASVGQSDNYFAMDGYFKFDLASGTQPFKVTSTTKVDNLNADLLDGFSTQVGDAVHNKIPIYGPNGVLKVNDPLSADDAANRRYVDSAIQGLDHKESVRVATTANVNVIGTANDLNAGDTIDEVALVAGDRVLVKSQTNALQNGIYIAPASGVAASRAADDGQGPNLLGDAGDFNSSVDLLSWSHNSIGAQGLENASLKLTNAGSGSDMRARTDSIALATEIGKTYKFSYYNLNGDSGGFAHLGTTSGGVEIKANVSTGQGTHTFTWQATSEVVYIEFGVTAAEADKYTFFDDVSVTQVDITDGAFVFVEEGTANENSSWVLGGDGSTWTQFGKAGMIDVTSNGAVAAPLTKSGDTINFAYNTTRFDLNSNALDIKDGGIDGGQLANDAVDASKLKDTAAFTMAGLTVNGAIAGTTLTLDGDTGEPTFGLKRDHSVNNNILEAKLAIVQAGTTDFGDLVFRTKTTASAGGSSSFFTDQLTVAGATGHVGIGADATSPSGTLHVSTARYGSSLVTNGTAWTGATGSTQPNSWTNPIAGTFTIDSSSGSGSEPALKIARNGSANHPYIYQTFAVATGRKYRVTYRVKNVDATKISVGLGSTANADQYNLTHHTSTSWVDFDQTFLATTDLFSIYAQVNTGTGTQSAYIDSVSVTEDSFADGVSDLGNDLVVNNNGATGISIISQTASSANLFFGDGVNNDHSRIFATRSLTTNDSSIEFHASDDNATAKAMTIFGHDKSMKIEGNLGVGMDADGVISGKTAADSEPAIQMFSHDSKTIFQVRDAGDSCLVKLYDNDEGNVVQKVELHTNGTSYFNGGSVAIGAATASDKLQIHGGGILLDSGYQLSWGDANNAIFGSAATDYVAIKTNGNDRFKIDTDGTFNHYGSPTVNSSTVQGLQDGACYDFDGTDGYIAVGTSLWSANGDRTFSIWLKADDFAAQHNIFHTEGGSGDFMIHTDGTIRIHPYTGNWQNTTSAISTGVWYHIVLTQTSSTRKIYVDGVEQTLGSPGEGSPQTEAWNVPDGELIIGEEGNSRDFFDGQIRDVKIFPSALDAGDVRKLYSGENPKKNLNVELIVVTDSATFTGGIGGWANGTSGVISHDSTNKELEVDPSVGYDSSNSFTSFAERSWLYVPTAAPAVVSGGDYLLSFDAYSASGSPKLWVNMVNATAGKQNVTLTTTKTRYSLLFHDINADDYMLFAADEAIRWNLDNVSIKEVNTLVDFNPRSASSTLWYNQAIPALYNGTLNGGVTLSAGSTDYEVGAGEDRKFNVGKFSTSVGPSAGTMRLSHYNLRGGPSAYALAQSSTGDTYINAATGKNIYFRVNNATIAQLGASGLGVGTVPGYELDVLKGTGATDDTNARVVAGRNAGLILESNKGNNLTPPVTGEAHIHFKNNGSNIWELYKRSNSTQDFTLYDYGSTNGGLKIRVPHDGTIMDLMGGSLTVETTSATANKWSTGGDLKIAADGSDALEFWTSGSTKIQKIHRDRTYILDGGTFSLGTSNPQGLLDVKGSIRGEADSYTKLLIHSDTTDGSTTFVDSSPQGHTVTAYNDAHHEVTNAKPSFGGSSIHFDGTGTGSYDYLEVADHADWEFGTGDFTIDTWVRFTDWATSGQTIMLNQYSGSGDWIFQLNYGKWGFYSNDAYHDASTGPSANTWYHFAVVRSSGTITLYVDGVSVLSYDGSHSISGSGPLEIGSYNSGASLPFNGLLDEVRISKGIARWTSDFTPPTRPYATVNDEYFADQDKISTLGFGTPLLREGALDGAGYTLNGTSDKIEADALATALAGTTTGTIRWRGIFNTGALGASNNGHRMWTFGDTSANEFIMFRAEATTNKLVGYCRDAGTTQWVFTTTSDFSEGRIYDLVMVHNGTTPVIYVDGVEETLTWNTTTDKAAWFSQCTGLDNLRIGSSLYNGSAESAFLPCTVLQFQAFPSALNSGEVAQLYNGYNPKKNLNVNLVTNGSFTTNSGWEGGASPGWGISGGNAVATNAPSSVNAQFYQTVTGLTAGKYYKLSFTVSSYTDGSVWAYFGTSSAGPIEYTPTLDGVGTASVVGKADDDEQFVSLQIKTAGTDLVVSEISLVEVGTLVDFNSRSASPATWYNSAIPALYNGTVTGATLSAGSTDHRIMGKLALGDMEQAETSSTWQNQITIPNGEHIAGVNYAGNGTQRLIGTASDRCIISQGTAATRVKFAGAPVIMDGPLLLGGLWSNYGGAGNVVTLANSEWLCGLSVAPADPVGNVRLIGLNGSNEVSIASEGGATTVGGNLTVAGVIAGTNGYHTLKRSTTDASGTGTVLELMWNYSAGGVVANNRGCRLAMGGETTGNNEDVTALLFDVPWTDITHATRTSDLVIQLTNSGTLAERFRLTGAGDLKVKGKVQAEADSYTKLLIHSDTTHNSTTFVDSSPSGHEVTYSGDPKHTVLSPPNAAFGDSSIHLDGSDRLLLEAHSDWNMGSGDFTIECWVKTTSDNDAIINQSNGSAVSNSSWLIWLDTAGKAGIYLTEDTAWDKYNISTTVVNDDEWHHIAAVRNGNSLRMYVDGVSSSSTDITGFTVATSSRWLEVGAQDNVSHYTGYVDEVRISKVARWSSDFQPPARPYSTVNDEFFNDYDKIAATGIGSGHLRIDNNNNLILGTLGVDDTTAQAPIHLNYDSGEADITSFTTMRDAAGMIIYSSSDLNNSWSGLMFSGADWVADGCTAGIYCRHTNVTENSETTDMRFYTSLNETFHTPLVLNGSDAKISGNLGVGMDPDTSYSIAALGATLWKNTMYLGEDRGLITWSDEIVGGSTSGFGMLAGSEQVLSLGANGTWDHLVISTSGHTTLSGKLILKDNPIIFDPDDHNTISPSDNYLTFRGFYGFRFETVEDALSNTGADTKLSISSDGTQNHQANRIVNSQTVNDLHRTAEPSLSFLGATASEPNTSDDYVDTGNTFDSTFSGSFTISAWVRLKDGQSSIQTIVGQSTASQNDHVQLQVNANGTITGQYYLNPNSAAVTSTVALPDGDTGWRHIVWTVKDEDAADTSILYLDGVNIKSAQNNAGGSMSGFGDGTDNLWIGAYNRNGGGYQFLGGEIKDVRIHNRALADTEVAAAYNGESTPHRYGDSNNTNLLSGTDTTCDGASNWVQNDATLAEGVSYNGRTAHTITSTAAGSYVALIAAANLAATGETTSRYWNITVDVYIPSGNSTWKGVQFHNAINNNGNTWTPTATNTWQTITHTVTENTAGDINTYILRLYAVDADGTMVSGTTGDVIGIDNIKFTRAGEVAAYTPQSINDKWYDTTSNANHGTIEGATSVNRTDQLGKQVIKGSSYLTATTRFADASGSLQIGGVSATCGRIDFTDNSTTEFSIDNKYNSASSKTSFGMRTSGTRLPVLELTGSGSVTATSGTSGNLKQVARVHNQTITGDGSTAFQITHNLGTTSIIVSVKENSTYQQVETAVETKDESSNNSTNQCRILFASAPANGAAYDVTVIG